MCRRCRRRREDRPPRGFLFYASRVFATPPPSRGRLGGGWRALVPKPIPTLALSLRGRGSKVLLVTAVELERVVRIGVYLHAGPCRLHVTADHVQAIADDGPRQSVTRHRHRRQYRPSVAR